MDKLAVVSQIIPHREIVRSKATAFAPANIALIKYWGKRNPQLNLPLNSSLSLSLCGFGATTSLTVLEEASQDIISLNGVVQEPSSEFATRLCSFLDLFRSKVFFSVATQSNLPVAAGLASSAAGFAACVKALDALYDWQLAESELSILARLGSGSACRSIWPGLVQWQCGWREDGFDSYGLPQNFPNLKLCMGLICVSDATKKISSREAMAATVASSPFFKLWPCVAEQDLVKVTGALQAGDFTTFGQVVEANAIAMHALMATARPAIVYNTPESLKLLQQINQLRQDGLEIYFTQDAGPNIKLLFQEQYLPDLWRYFPKLQLVFSQE